MSGFLSFARDLEKTRRQLPWQTKIIYAGIIRARKKPARFFYLSPNKQLAYPETLKYHIRQHKLL